MLNNDQQQQQQIPRISFSTDFSSSDNTSNDMKHAHKNYREAPVSSDFEFCISGFNIINSADELFSKGKIIPLRDNNNFTKTTTTSSTIRDELLVEDDDYMDFSPAVGGGPRFSRGWRQRLGLKKPHHFLPAARKPADYKDAL